MQSKVAPKKSPNTLTSRNSFSSQDKAHAKTIARPQFNSELTPPKSSSKDPHKYDQAIKPVSSCNNHEPKALDFAALIEQMRSEKQKFYNKLNSLSYRRNENNGSSIMTVENQNCESGIDEGDEPNFSKKANFSALLEAETRDLKLEFCSKYELNEKSQKKVVYELEKSKEEREKVFYDLTGDLKQKEDQLQKLRSTQEDLKNSLREFLNSLKEENQDLEKRLENARETLSSQEKLEKENATKIHVYENDIKNLEEMLEIHKEESEKELRSLNNELCREQGKYESLLKKAGELSDFIEINQQEALEYEEIQKELDEKMSTLSKWQEKKASLERKYQNLVQESTAAFSNLMDQIGEKTEEAKRKKREIEEMCQADERELGLIKEGIREKEEELEKKRDLEEKRRIAQAIENEKLKQEMEKMEDELATLDKNHKEELEKIEAAKCQIQEKVTETERSLMELEKMHDDLSREYEESKEIFQKQMGSVEKEIRYYAEENRTLKENIERKKKDSKQVSLDKEGFDRGNVELKSLSLEVEKMKKEVEKLKKLKLNLEEEIQTMNASSNREMDKGNKGMMDGVKKQVEQLKKKKMENAEGIKKMQEDKENLEKELREIQKRTDYYQREIEESLESINMLNTKESVTMKKRKTVKN